MPTTQGELDVLASLADSPEKLELIQRAQSCHLQVGSFELESLYWEHFEKERRAAKAKKKQLKQQLKQERKLERQQQRDQSRRSSWKAALSSMKDAIIVGASSMAMISYPVGAITPNFEPTSSIDTESTYTYTDTSTEASSLKSRVKSSKPKKTVRFYTQDDASTSTIAVSETSSRLPSNASSARTDATAPYYSTYWFF